MRSLLKLSIAVVLFFAAAAAAAQAQIVPVGGLVSSVTVRRDARSIPYVEAANDRDLYFVQGYVTASDRLWQMDLMRRVASGETAEIFGKQALEEDKRWRRFGFAKIAQESLQYHSPELRAALEAYAAGVNAYMATLDEKTLPIEFRILQYRPREWRPADAILIGKILADALSTTWRNDLLRASLEKLPTDKLADLTNPVTPYDVVLFGNDQRQVKVARQKVLDLPDSMIAAAGRDEELRKNSLQMLGLYAEELAASNNWVISGKRTADGKPILANDPHLQSTAPGIWYLTHLSTPQMRISGVTIPGVPGIILGHNESIAWGATNVGPDVQDLYSESFDADGKYKTPTGTAAPIVRTEEIRVRTNPLKTDTEIVKLDVVETRNGVIILEEGNKKYALQWTARDPKNREFEAFFLLNRAKNWEDFSKALQSYRGATQNFVFADVKGNIGWYAAGHIPIRRTGEGALPYDGATNQGDWTGFIPFEELPNLYNPPEGLIVTANQRIVGTSYRYPQMSRDAAPPWRARRIYDLLKDNRKLTMDDVSAVQHDVYNIPLVGISKRAASSKAPVAGSGNGIDAAIDAAQIRSELQNWDGRMLPALRAPLFANEIRNCLANKVAEENKPVPAYLVRERVLYWAVANRSARWLPKGFADYDSLIDTCVSESAAGLQKRYGSDATKLTWGSVSQARFVHPLAAAPLIGTQFAIPPVGLAGSGQTPNVATYVSMRHIASPGNWDATRQVIPLGQSGDPQSPHFKDQFELWRTGAAAVFPFSKAAVAAAGKQVVVFQPK